MLQASDKTHGYTLIELLITVFIVSLLLGVAVPSFSNARQKLLTQTAANELIRHYRTARSAAIKLQTDVIYCPMDTSTIKLIGYKCGKDWTHGAAIFQDRNKNYTIDQASDVLLLIPPSKTGVQVTMRAGLNKQYFRIIASGFLENTAGSMVFCGADNNVQHASVVIFNRNGRMRLGGDKNKDGIPENAEGQPISCPP